MNSHATAGSGVNSPAGSRCHINQCRLVPCFDTATGEPLREIVIAPDGIVESKAGTFLVDAEAGRMVEEAFQAHANDLPIDYEHQSMQGKYSSPSGLAPAAGWIKRIWHEAGRGLIAAVDWTERALQMIRNREYRYLSPVTYVREEDQRVVEIDSAALTNIPAIPRMEPLVAKRSPLHKEVHAMPENQETATPVETGGTDVMLIKLGEVIRLYDLKIEGEPSPEAVLDALLKKGEGESKKEGEGEGGEPVASKRVLEALGAKPDAAESEILVTINTLKKGHDQVGAMKTQLDQVVNKLAERDADDAVAPYLADGRINPNDADDVKVCRQLAMSNREQFEHHMKRRVANPPPGKTTPPPGGPGGNSREQVIAHARREYNEGGTEGRLTDRDVFVNQALRDANLFGLTEDERKELRVA